MKKIALLFLVSCSSLVSMNNNSQKPPAAQQESKAKEKPQEPVIKQNIGAFLLTLVQPKIDSIRREYPHLTDQEFRRVLYERDPQVGYLD